MIKYKSLWAGSQENVATFELTSDTTLFGWLTLFTTKVTIKLIGPAYNEIRFKMGLFNFEGIYTQVFVPLSHHQTKIVFNLYGSRGPINYLLGKILLFGESQIVCLIICLSLY